MSNQQNEQPGVKILVENRKARFRYHILESFEAGIVLKGSEIKSIRMGAAHISESYVRPMNGEMMWLGATIEPYKFSSHDQPAPDRTRKLLLSKHEIEKLSSSVKTEGMTIVPLKLYLKAGRAKLEIGLARGKDAPDKRQAIKERDSKRRMARATKTSR